MPAEWLPAVEWLAVVFSLASVILTVAQSLWCWPTGLIAVVAYGAVFYESRLYSEAALQIVYVVMQCYGWWYWLKIGPDREPPRVSRLSRRELIAWIGAGIAGSAALGGVMDAATSASLPYADATVTVFSLIAQWLLGRKVLESWWAWILVDVLAIGVYAGKGLVPSAGLYAVFLVMAYFGWLRWRKAWRDRPALA